MLAIAVTYADEINAASARFSVQQSLIQSIMDIAGSPSNVTGINDPDAVKYAQQYAVNRHKADNASNGGVGFPEANIMACAWFLVRLNQTYGGDEWTAIKAYFGMSPIGEAKMRRLFYKVKPAYDKMWSGLS